MYVVRHSSLSLEMMLERRLQAPSSPNSTRHSTIVVEKLNNSFTLRSIFHNMAAARQTTKKLFQNYPTLKQGIERVQQEVFGCAPNLGVRTGNQKANKAMTGVYLNRYYLDRMDTSARKVRGCSLVRRIFFKNILCAGV